MLATRPPLHRFISMHEIKQHKTLSCHMIDHTIINNRLEPKSRKSQPPPKMAEPAPWEEVRAQLAAVLRAGVDEHPPPFDAASEVPIDQQKYVII